MDEGSCRIPLLIIKSEKCGKKEKSSTKKGKNRQGQEKRTQLVAGISSEILLHATLSQAGCQFQINYK